MVSEKEFQKALEDIETLQKEIAELREDFAQVTKQLRQELLEIWRLNAQLKVNADSETIRDIIQTQLPNSNHLKAQEIKDMTDAKTQIESSNKPLQIAADYQAKWIKIVRDSGAKFIIT